MTYAELYQWAAARLERFDAGQLFTYATNQPVFHMPLVGRREAPEAQAALLEGLVERRLEGEPLQYLLGEWEFYGLPMKVGRGALIPRADTETLVDVALELIRDIPAPEVLDLCSGTGCVAIAIAHERPQAFVTALELSEAACAYLERNIALNNSPVKLARRDLREYAHPKPLHLLVSNPPYIPRQDMETLQTEVRREPEMALDGGPDGLDFYRDILRLYRGQIRPGGWAALEVGIGQDAQVGELLRSQGFEEVDSRRDYGGVARVVFGRTPESETR